MTSEEPSHISHVDRRPTLTQVLGLGPIEALDGKEDYVCALDSAGSVHCWGCLLGGEECTLWPARVELQEAARSIAVGVDGACALLASGEVWCWGLAADGGIEPPSKVGPLRDVVQLSATALGRCARHRDGTVTCWGDSLDNEPTRIAGLARAHMISSNRSYSCAITGAERSIQCWGLPESQHTRWQSGLPRSAAAMQVVRTLSALRDVRQLELGERFGVAVTDDGSLYHWGAARKDGIYALGGKRAPRERADLADSAEPRRGAASASQDLDLEVARVGEHLKVKRAIVSGYHVCLDLERDGLRCEPALARAPFQIEEVWPQVRFGAGAEP
jgi:alpha-tubulin suppressor-like RCC1 family protein